MISYHTPRFLFRAWSPVSGGDARLNTTTAITPHAFLDKDGPSSFYDVHREDLAFLARSHLWGEYCESVFSSWSQSLAFVLSLALYIQQPETSYVGVIDTKRLPRKNVILHTTKMRFLSDDFEISDCYKWEYLAFGIISGEAYRAVAVQEFIKQGYDSSAWNAPALPVPRKVRRSRRLARLYGQQFELPITVYLLCLNERKVNDNPWSTRRRFAEKWTVQERECIMSNLRTLTIPDEWLEDGSILDVHQDFFGGYDDAALAIAILADLITTKKQKQSNRRSKKLFNSDDHESDVSDLPVGGSTR